MPEQRNLNFTENLHPAFLSLLVSKTVQTAGSFCVSQLISNKLINFRTISVTVAIDAMSSASNPHAFMGVTEQGLASIVKTRGNQDLHVILRGGTSGPNYSAEHVAKVVSDIEKKRKEKFASVMIDCSRTSPLLWTW